MIKLCFIDVETCGLDAKKNGVIQIAGQISFLDDKIEDKESFNYKLRPFPDDIVEDKALEVNGVTKEQIENYPQPQDIYREFVKLLSAFCDKYNRQDKLFFVGYNARFDYDFMRAWFEKNGDQYFGSFFFFPPMDVMNIAIFKMIEQRHLLPNFKLETVANHLKVTAEGDFHDAMKDIIVTKEIFLKYLDVKEEKE